MAYKIGSIEEATDKKCFEADGRKIAVFNIGKEFYAIDNACTHKGGPLCKGELNGNIVTCPWHGAKFNVTTGEVVGPPAMKNEASHKVTVKGNDVYAELAAKGKRI